MTLRICVEQKAPDLSATAVFAGFFSTVKLSDYFNSKHEIL